MKIFKGKVISTKMNKVVTVLVEKTTMHPLYGKRYKRSRKYQVHDELAHTVGDEVLFAASKPYSRNVKWKIVGIKNNKTGDLKKKRLHEGKVKEKQK